MGPTRLIICTALILGGYGVFGQGLANVPQPKVYGQLGGSAKLSCESYKFPLSSCFWEKPNPKDSSNPILINFNPVNAIVSGDFRRRQRPGQRYSYNGVGLSAGDCSILIHPVEEEDFTAWRCTMFQRNYQVLKGVVQLIPSNGHSPLKMDYEQKLASLQEQDRRIQGEIKKLEAELLQQVRKQTSESPDRVASRPFPPPPGFPVTASKTKEEEGGPNYEEVKVESPVFVIRPTGIKSHRQTS